MWIGCSECSYREARPVGESHFISFNPKQFYAGTGKASGTTGAGRIAVSDVADISREP